MSSEQLPGADAPRVDTPSAEAPSTDLPRAYDPHAAAARFYPQWEQAGLFKGDPDAPGEPFCIVIPPPNVTGSLHMGHALDNTLQDILIRYKRMDGYCTLWIPGTDHAGIATQTVVERQLAKYGTNRHELGREAFVERVWVWKAESGSRIFRQLRALGVSCDWSRERFTMDEGLSHAVRVVFAKMYDEGLIYRDTRMVNWDPASRTVLSDLEVEYDEGFKAELWHFAYPLSDGSGEIVVATTRPETMLGDTAVAVHPEDERYKALIGRTVRHPLLDREIPIIGDAILVDPAFGTGAVKVTPSHDPNDYEVGRRHKLPFINILDEAAHINQNGGRFQGMERYAARAAVKEAIASLGLDRGSKEHIMSVGRSQRSGVIVEPIVSTQWFVRMKPLAAPATAAVERGFTRFVPQQWENLYFAWMRDIRDWCISRQLWWGHQIPAWYCDACNHTNVAVNTPSACSACGSDQLRQDPDVLDTWFSSALWPFSTMGWPQDTPDLRRWYPTSVLVTGFDIIFFWVARMMFSGIHNLGSVPFKDVCIHGLVRDAKGEKMSKTRGNVVDPLGTIERYGCDAFRFTLAQCAVQGRDINWDDNRVEVNTRFVHKLWQAFRYLHTNLEGYDPQATPALSVYDHWILARTGQAVSRIREALDGYKFNDAANELYNFSWGELCDWYLELSKQAIYGGGEGRQAAQHTLVTVFSALARVMHPIMPFLSEELWTRLPGSSGSVMVAPFPKTADFPSDDAVLAELAVLQEAITALRRLRSEMGLSPKLAFELLTRGEHAGVLARHAGAMKHLAGVTQQTALVGEPPAGSATVVSRGVDMFLPLVGLVDLGAERIRLDKEIQRVDKDVSDIERRLNNPGFTDRAPAALVAEFQGKLAAARDKLKQLTASRAALD